MDVIGVDLVEFQKNLNKYLYGKTALRITLGGRELGQYVPLPRRKKLNKKERAAISEQAARFHETLAQAGVTEDELIEDFKRWRKASRQKSE